jgi:hypothetical protein
MIMLEFLASPIKKVLAGSDLLLVKVAAAYRTETLLPSRLSSRKNQWPTMTLVNMLYVPHSCTIGMGGVSISATLLLPGTGNSSREESGME